MIPIPVPQPPPQYVPVSIEWSRKRRRQLGLTGSVLVLVSLAVAGAGIPLVFSLPDMGGVAEIMWVGFLAVSVFFSFAMGVLCLLGVSYIKNGWLNLTAAQGLWRSSLVVWIFSVIGGVLGAAVLALGAASAARDGAAPGVATALCFLATILPAAMCGAAWTTVVQRIRW